MNLQDSIHKLPSHLSYYKDVIHKVAEYMGEKEVRFWELLKRGYRKPKLKEIEHFRFYTNKPLDGVEFDYCCHPKVGDQIVAFYKDSKAIIHHKLCKHAYAKIKAGEEMVHINWRSSKMSRYRLIISLQNQKGALADMLTKRIQRKVQNFSHTPAGSTKIPCTLKIKPELCMMTDPRIRCRVILSSK
jgi:(p)ppGpp synthase/HD superfamily hydrolase